MVNQLADHIAQMQPGLRGFTRPNLFRMRQFYETYKDDLKVSPLLRQLRWTHNLILLGQSKHPAECDVRKPHENTAIGVLLCASKDDEVVEYALSRTASSALIAQYETRLPDKALLQSKLYEFYLQNMGASDDSV